MRSKWLLLLGCIILLVMIGASSWAAQARRAAQPAQRIDPKARALVIQMSNYLQSLSGFSVHAETITAFNFPSGDKLHASRAVDLYLQRPNRIRANVISANREVQFFYDGRQGFIYTPQQRYYAQFPASPTINQAIDQAQSRYGIVMPLLSLTRSDLATIILSRTNRGYYIGPSMVNGIRAQHVALRGQKLELEIWIQDGPTPLPLMIITTEYKEKGAPSFIATLSCWNTAPTYTEDIFTFVPPSGAQKIKIKDFQEQTPRARLRSRK